MSEEERPTLRREVSVEVAEGDGRTLVARLVPYNEVANVNDGGGPYQEMFLPGAFNAQTRAANRIKAFLNFRHSQAFGDQIGHATKIDDLADGLHGEMYVKPGPHGDDALHFVREGVLNKLSIEFQPLKDKIVDGVVHRVSARLLGVALVPEGAYSGAEVIAVREGEELPEELVQSEDDAPVTTREAVSPVSPLSPEVMEILERVGIDTALRAVVDKPWDGSASRYADTAAYCAACLIDENPSGGEKSQAKCHLPIKEPNGDININAVRNALARVNQVQASSANKAAARNRCQQILASYNKGT